MQNISTVCNANEWFDKTFVLAFYDSFLKKEIKCDKENMLILDTCSLQKKLLSNLTCVQMICTLTLKVY